MPWKLAVTARATKDLTDVGPRDRASIERAFDRLAIAPHLADISKLQGTHDEWRARVGRWRIILRLENDTGTIVVLRVLPRGIAYR